MKTILVIEDDQALLRLEQKILGDAGYAVESVSDGAAARTKLTATPYHGIVLDLAVPGSDGYALATQVGELGANRHTPLVIVGADQPDGRKRAFEAGALAYLPKPFTAEAFRAVIHSVISPAGPRAPSAPRAGFRPGSAPRAPAPFGAAPAPRDAAPTPAEAGPSAAAIPVSFQGGPVYWCEPVPGGGWRCGRCELGLIAETAHSCSVCQAVVGAPPERRGSGLLWLIVLIVLGLLLGWAVLEWGS
jgi:CheY-like chemotaxis protein